MVDPVLVDTVRSRLAQDRYPADPVVCRAAAESAASQTTLVRPTTVPDAVCEGSGQSHSLDRTMRE